MTNINNHQTPRELGYRMPAEWEKHGAIWLQWPGRHPSALGDKDLSYQMKLEKTWVLMAWEIHRVARLEILAQSDAQRSHIFELMNYYGFKMTRVSIHVTRDSRDSNSRCMAARHRADLYRR
jgi:agmatine/peptidylarginine deiminase